MAFQIFILSLLLFSIHSYAQNVTVASDGTGDFNTIGAALQVAPNNSLVPYSIYVKAGTYKENIHLGMEKTNIILYGDGINKTIIVSDRSNSSGYSIQDSPTIDVSANRFVAKYISIVNSAGPKGGQAVALRTWGENITFYRCSIEGYQDTLFAVYGHQFFYECDIYGTIDFIFGDAAVIFQNCFIYARKPLKDQGNVITAEGRVNNTQNSGIVLHNCTITAAPEFIPYKGSVKTYLGRAWKIYSRTVVMESYLDDLIDPAGWSLMTNDSFIKTVYYAEYKNRGPGASTDKRVNWPGFVVLNNPNEVKKFTVKNFIYGDQWLPSFGVPFIPGLIG